MLQKSRLLLVFSVILVALFVFITSILISINYNKFISFIKPISTVTPIYTPVTTAPPSVTVQPTNSYIYPSINTTPSPNPNTSINPSIVPSISPTPKVSSLQTPKPSTIPSNTTISWYYIANPNHTTPDVDKRVRISEYDGCYVGNTKLKKIYLTMDIGYEAGYTNTILDKLKEADVKVTFFLTKPFIVNNPEKVLRMVNEGHVVGNHTNTHHLLPSLINTPSLFNDELLSTSSEFKSITGVDMLKIMRPPNGVYSVASLAMTKALGYKTIFWSFAYKDYDLNKQPDEAYALQLICSGTHNGAIMLLHGVSRTNTNILKEVLENIKNQGYTFDTLDHLN